MIVIHDTQISLLEGFCHSLWHFGLGFDDLRLHFLGIGAHFLLLGNGHGTAFFGSCLCDLLICFCLIGLELGADISAYIDIGDIDGEDLKSCPRVETFAEDRTGNVIRILQYVGVLFGGADGRDDAFADTGDDGRFPCPADEAIDIRTDGDTGADLELDAVFRDRRNGRGLDDLRIDAHLDGFEDIASCQVDGGCLLEGEIDLCAMRGDQGIDDVIHIAARQVVRFELVHAEEKSRLRAFDERQHDHLRRDAADPHPHQIEEGDIHIRGERGDPESDRHEVQQDGQSCDGDEKNDHRKE